MDVSATTSTTTTPTTNTKASPVISSDFETFLKMLTTQMENQDPLNPVESSDFAVQLATFSGVEQQVQTNNLLSQLSTQMGTSSMAQFAGWVGMEARVAAPASYNGQPVTVIPEPQALADRATLVVKDASGATVQRLELSVNGDPYTWSGLNDAGIPLKDGLYSFSVESYSNGALLGTTPAEVYATVTEARISDGATTLVLDGGTEVSTTAVTALRN
ncbi:flagellar hook capping FlgD N-terminal domain-containing protein [Actibacterium lipolyticum]|uniref:Basal-body rod modification protein FlgD n=1 Tax=Actibacterium lipolyticum TaxID=1524263 RepID=A0A238KXW3_9RHOB|nr:flagellar hook capping FlgD N-terminal domain-containing protein [Actibacterium lipolyticum]SMX47480.1 Basal-body rod modification protein FlgD [Actibacterium lipolyticum]